MKDEQEEVLEQTDEKTDITQDVGAPTLKGSGSPKPWDPTPSVFFIPYRCLNTDFMSALQAMQPGDIIGVEDDFHITELDMDTHKIKEHGCRFELKDGKLKRTDNG